MPEVIFTVVWPDGEEEQCYSPSSVIRDHLEAGASYALDEFVAKARSGLIEASGRVSMKYGFACASAMGQLARIEARARLYEASAEPQVRCIGMEG